MPRLLPSAARYVLPLFVSLLFACDKGQPAPAPASSSVSAKPAASALAVASSAPAPAVSSAAAPPGPVGDRGGPVGLRPWRKAFLWRIDGPKPSYLLGTIHLPDDRLEPLLPIVKRMVDNSDVVVSEAPLDNASQQSMVQKVMLPGNRSLKTEVPAELYDRVAKLFAEKSLPIEALGKMKVWAIATEIPLLDKLVVLATKKPLDVRIFAEATEHKKVTQGLETVDEQLAVFDGLSKDEQARMLREELDLLAKQKKEGKDPLEETMVPYLAGDADKLREEIMATFDPKNPLDVKMMKRLFTDRNEIMSERIEAKLKATPAQSYFFAVGAGHVVGDDGIVATLGAHGLKLTRVE